MINLELNLEDINLANVESPAEGDDEDPGYYPMLVTAE